jgi:hypothetical protein
MIIQLNSAIISTVEQSWLFTGHCTEANNNNSYISHGSNSGASAGCANTPSGGQQDSCSTSIFTVDPQAAYLTASPDSGWSSSRPADPNSDAASRRAAANGWVSRTFRRSRSAYRPKTNMVQVGPTLFVTPSIPSFKFDMPVVISC